MEAWGKKGQEKRNTDLLSIHRIFALSSCQNWQLAFCRSNFWLASYHENIYDKSMLFMYLGLHENKLLSCPSQLTFVFGVVHSSRWILFLTLLADSWSVSTCICWNFWTTNEHSFRHFIYIEWFLKHRMVVKYMWLKEICQSRTELLVNYYNREAILS